jgi:hypothetical protein
MTLGDVSPRSRKRVPDDDWNPKPVLSLRPIAHFFVQLLMGRVNLSVTGS